MPPLYTRPRHAAPRDHGKVRAALVPAVLLASSGTALGGLAAGASAAQGAPRATAVASTIDLQAAQVDRANALELAAARADRARAAQTQAQELAAQQAAEQAAAEKAAAEKAAAEAEAARPKYARPNVGVLTSPFGYRWGGLHPGIDIAAPWGSPVVAAADGVVESARWEGGYGMCVRVRLPDGTENVYAHLSAFIASPGQQVKAGEQIAREGNTGFSTGPHLHFEVRIGGSPVNPIPWLQERGITI